MAGSVSDQRSQLDPALMDKASCLNADKAICLSHCAFVSTEGDEAARGEVSGSNGAVLCGESESHIEGVCVWCVCACACVCCG